MYCSPLKLTYHGHVILDYDDEMDGPVSMPGSGQAQVVDFAGGLTGAVFGRGNSRHAMSWSRTKQWTSHDEAHGMSLAMMGIIPRGKAGTLTIELQSGVAFELRNFVLERVDFRLVVETGFPVREEYEGQGEELVVTARGTLGGDEMGEVTNTDDMGEVTNLETMGE